MPSDELDDATEQRRSAFDDVEEDRNDKTGVNGRPSPRASLDPLSDDEPAPDFEPGRDIYGEDELPPEGEDEPDAPSGRSGGARPVLTTETRVGRIEDEAQWDDDSPDATRAGPPIKLQIVAGPDAGKTKRFRGVRMVVGRTQGCELKLSDTSVSRKHFELVQGDSGVLLRDLGSGNGTKVNGEKATEQVLQDGDEISVGKTRMRFVDEMAAFKNAQKKAGAPAPRVSRGAAPARQQEEDETSDDEPSLAARSKDEVDPEDPRLHTETVARMQMPKGPPSVRVRPVPSRHLATRNGASEEGDERKPNRRWMLATAAAGGLLLLILVLVLRKPPPPPPDPNLPIAAQKMQQARDATRAGDFKAAVALAQEAEKLVPGSDVDGLAARANKELEAQEKIEQIRTHVAEKRYDEAREALAALPQASLNVEESRKQLAQEIEAKRSADLRAQVETAVAAGDLDGARLALAKLPDEDQSRLSALISQAEARNSEDLRRESRKHSAARDAARKRQEAERQAFIESAFTPVSRKFHQGEFPRAASECDRVADAFRDDEGIRKRAAQLKRLIPNFARAFDEAQKKYKAGSLEAATRPLRQAKQLYAQIGFEGSLGPLIDEQLASAALSAGQSAAARQDYANAVRFYREALKLNPDEERAKDGLERLASRAEDLFMQAYSQRATDPAEAISKLKLVLTLAPESSPTHAKAKTQLESLQR